MLLSMGIAFILNAFFVLFLSYVMPGIKLSSYYVALLITLLLAAVNAFTHTILHLGSLPHNYITYSLLSLILSIVLFSLFVKVIPGLECDGWNWILSFAALIAIFNGTVHVLLFNKLFGFV